MNHGIEEEKIAVQKKYLELLTGQVYNEGEFILLPGREVMILKRQD